MVHNVPRRSHVIISCPECGTGYLLPEHLIGPGGASVRCPRCQQLFAVDARGLPQVPVGPQGGEQALAPAPEPEAARRAKPAGGAPLAVARAVLERLSRDHGHAIERARDEHRLFADYGPTLMAALETYRREAGEEAGPGPFREALRERWGVELLPLAPAAD
jgi:predicted Zn finger-like uncharacterized protein